MNNVETVQPCYACGGCRESCSFSALHILKDTHGIAYPVVDKEFCKNCSLCVKRCKISIETNKPIQCFVFESKNEKDLLNASSGGSFFELAKTFWVEKEAIIYGVAYDDSLSVIHQAAYDLDGIRRFRKSKYIQSELGNTFHEIKEYLNLGYHVMFSGTPCQVAGLKKYLACDFKNLITVDLICTGVIAPIIFSRFLQEYYDCDITGFDWRYKHKLNNSEEWNIMDSAVEINGNIIQDELSILIKRLYGRKIGYKEACYSCQYANLDRCSDITLGDYWSIKSIFGDYPNRGISAVLVNTQKGYKLIESIDKHQMNIQSISLNQIVNQNPALTHSSVRPPKNDDFWIDFENIEMKKLLKKYTRNSLKSTLKMAIASVIPKTVYQWLHENK